MKNLCNLTIASSIFFILIGCTGNDSFSSLNKKILDTSDNLLQVSRSLRGAQDDSSITTDESTTQNNPSNNKSSKKVYSNKSTAYSNRLFNECMENNRTKLRFNMGKSVEQIDAEIERENAYNTKYCTCTLPYEEAALGKLSALGFDGSDASISKMQKDPVKRKKINEIITKLSLDRSQNCTNI